ncbi:gamma-type small acid-soluble spore protein [Heyndrickxia ginsengihumi]|nr:gamma-type small acid-soluble spore protein [Heyndrickxia ginsengihumi]MBE6184179.1 gamma-type small acid-soluble spore protein [Bacillus sp. (in: firmicutes)]MCM3024471.1 gamma-type small acid-soluble spore protein [Heyndrickxia ginsengihumi]NEY20194.1 gamma-type small acid-soluble spore protein [Heyndrickxia ginsengihumi]
MNQKNKAAQGQFGTEFASETNAQEVRKQNAKSAQGAQGQFGTEFASETNAQEVRKQNQQAEANKSKNVGK